MLLPQMFFLKWWVLPMFISLIIIAMGFKTLTPGPSLMAETMCTFIPRNNQHDRNYRWFTLPHTCVWKVVDAPPNNTTQVLMGSDTINKELTIQIGSDFEMEHILFLNQILNQHPSRPQQWVGVWMEQMANTLWQIHDHSHRVLRNTVQRYR